MRCAAGRPGRARKSAPAALRRDFRGVAAPRWSPKVHQGADNHRRAGSPGLSGQVGRLGLSCSPDRAFAGRAGVPDYPPLARPSRKGA